jgi:hypothetical protein
MGRLFVTHTNADTERTLRRAHLLCTSAFAGVALGLHIKLGAGYGVPAGRIASVDNFARRSAFKTF